MSVDFWVAAETFYNTTMVAVAIIILSLVMLSGMIYAYSKSQSRKKIAAGGSILAIILGIGLGIGHWRYQDFLALNDYVTPLVRDRQKAFSDYTYRSEDEMDYFAKMHDPESVRSLGIYHESVVTQPVTYVGKDEFFYYFEQDGELFKQRGNVIFDEQAEATQLVGSAFALENEAFMEIGFRNPPYIMFDYLIVNQAEESELIDVEKDDFVETTEEYFAQTWSF